MLGLLFGLLSGVLFDLLLFADFDSVVLLVPLPEGGSVDGNDVVLDEGLSALEFVVSGVVLNFQDFGLPSDLFGAPRVVAMVLAESSKLEVATTTLDGADALGAEFGHGSLATHLKEALLLVNGHAAASGSAFVPGVATDTHLI